MSEIIDDMINALEDILNFLMENAPMFGAVGGSAASTALTMYPSLPMTTASVTPPGTQTPWITQIWVRLFSKTVW